jgi:hypothetical protein
MKAGRREFSCMSPTEWDVQSPSFPPAAARVLNEFDAFHAPTSIPFNTGERSGGILPETDLNGGNVMPENTSAILLVTLCLGVILGLVGTGGALLIPALIFVFGMEQRSAQGTALLISAMPVAFIPFLPYFRLGHYDLRIGLLGAIGLAVGGYVGSELAGNSSEISSLRVGDGVGNRRSAHVLRRILAREITLKNHIGRSKNALAVSPAASQPCLPVVSFACRLRRAWYCHAGRGCAYGDSPGAVWRRPLGDQGRLRRP